MRKLLKFLIQAQNATPFPRVGTVCVNDCTDCYSDMNPSFCLHYALKRVWNLQKHFKTSKTTLNYDSFVQSANFRECCDVTKMRASHWLIVNWPALKRTEIRKRLLLIPKTIFPQPFRCHLVQVWMQQWSQTITLDVKIMKSSQFQNFTKSHETSFDNNLLIYL